MMKKILAISLFLFSISLMSACTSTPPKDSETTKSSSTLPTTSSTATTETTASSSAPQTSGATADITDNGIVLSFSEAIAIFQKEFPDVDIAELKLGADHSVYYYEFEGLDDEKEYELKFNATTEEIVKKEAENLEQDEAGGVKRAEEKLTLSDLKSQAEITQLAQTAVSSGQAVSWKVEKKLGLTYWEVEVKKDNQEVEVKIENATGEILKKETDD